VADLVLVEQVVEVLAEAAGILVVALAVLGAITAIDLVEMADLAAAVAVHTQVEVNQFVLETVVLAVAAEVLVVLTLLQELAEPLLFSFTPKGK
jgi:hypothetical protein